MDNSVEALLEWLDSIMANIKTDSVMERAKIDSLVHGYIHQGLWRGNICSALKREFGEKRFWEIFIDCDIYL
jgi:hypothetical protein